MRLHTQPIAEAPRHWITLLIAVLIVCYAAAAITPPFQAPDEFDHIKRAYMFGNGQLVLHAPAGQPSGGMVDIGLTDYMNSFVPLAGKANRKVSADELGIAGTVMWTGTDTFQTPIGTAYYFPVIYAPQAAGLMIGKTLGLSVGRSYQLVRLLTLFACLGLIYLACRIFPPPPILLAIIVLPMNLFLLSSPTLDGMATSMGVVAIAAFMRIATDKHDTPTWILATFTISVVLLTACRANAAPFLLLPFVVWWYLRDRRSLVTALACAVLVIGWTLFAIKSTVYPPGPRHIDHTAKLLSYVIHPGDFFSILHATLADPGVRAYYWQSFLGNLGWLDAPLKLSTYYVIAALLGVVLALSLARAALYHERLARGALLVCAIATLLMTYLAMLVQWTVGDSPIIQGVQGRYFMIPAIAIAFAIGGDRNPRNGALRQISTAAVVLLLAISTHTMIRTLIVRYYMPASQESASPAMLKPTAPLTTHAPLALHLSSAQSITPATLGRIDLMFGTYMRRHEGEATLRLWTNGGETQSASFDLSTLVDNGYKRFDVPPRPYVGGEIVSDGGEGVSIWESQTGDNPPLACSVIHTSDRREVTIAGCPRP